MPNNCNSIFKLFLIVLMFSFYSCTNFDQLSSKTRVFNAKFQFSNEPNIYKSNITVFKDSIIIQFNELFIGNVGKIELSANGDIKSNFILNRNEDEFIKEISNFFSAKYFDLIYKCLELNKTNYNDSIISLSCNKYGDIFIKFKENSYYLNIKLIVSRKIERAKITPTEIK